jgi:hypothetical protein
VLSIRIALIKRKQAKVNSYVYKLLVIQFINKATARVREILGNVPYSTRLPDCWIEVSTHPEGPATGHFDTGSPGVLLSSSE